MQSFYRFLRIGWPYIGSLIGVYSLGKGLGVSVGQALVATGNFVAQTNALWFALSLVCFFLVYTSLRHRGIPLTIVRTKVEVTFESADGRLARVTRTQKLRANREDVTGYFKQMWCDGKLRADSLECSISHCDQHHQSFQVEPSGTGWELVHTFDPIPQNVFLLNLNTVTRTERLVMEDAFLADEESYEIVIPQPYRHRHIELVINFHQDRPCLMTACRGTRISAHGVLQLPLLSEGPRGVKIVASNAYPGERFKIVWKWPRVTLADPQSL